MWGDNPDDFKTRYCKTGLVVLPLSVTLICGSVLDLEWITTLESDPHPAYVVVVRWHRSRNCPYDQTSALKKIEEIQNELLKRYRENCITPPVDA